MGATFALSYHFIVKPRMYQIKASISDTELEPDTDFVTGRLYRVEGRQVLIVPAVCELSVSRVKIRRQSGALVIYPRDQSWSEYSELLPADSVTVSERPDANNSQEKK